MFLIHDAEKNILPLLEPEKLGKFPLFLKTKGFPKFRQDTHLQNTAAILTTRGGRATQPLNMAAQFVKFGVPMIVSGSRSAYEQGLHKDMS